MTGVGRDFNKKKEILLTKKSLKTKKETFTEVSFLVFRDSRDFMSFIMCRTKQFRQREPRNHYKGFFFSFYRFQRFYELHNVPHIAV